MAPEPSEELLSRWRACVAGVDSVALSDARSEQVQLAQAAEFVDCLPFEVERRPTLNHARPCELVSSDVAVCTAQLASVDGLETVVGLDISFVGDGDDRAVAVLAVLSFASLELVRTIIRRIVLDQPYKPGFLAFREAPVLIEMLAQLPVPPSLVLIDGNGRWHPRQAGLAVAVGLGAGVPTIGVAKEYMPLWTEGAEEPSVWPTWATSQKTVHKVGREVLRQRGDHVKLGRNGDEEAHAAVRDPCNRRGLSGQLLRSSTDPTASRTVVVSPGHRISLDTAVQLVLACCRTRVPEPIRAADLAGREEVRQWAAELATGA